MADLTPEQVSIALGKVHQAYTSNYEKFKELSCIQQLLLHSKDLVWNKEDIPQQYHDMRRTADIIKDDSEDNLFMRKVESEPCTIYQYQVSTHQWQQLGQSIPYRCSMAMAYQNCIMFIGGAVTRDDNAQHSGEILGFVNGEWIHLYPNMPTARSRSLALTCTFNYAKLLIVIGGEGDNDVSLKTVEILDMTNPNPAWKTANDLPEIVCSSSGTVAGGYIYVLGGWSKRNNPSSAVFRCSIAALVESTTRSNAVNVWEKLPDLPVEEATCTTFHNTLIVVGGRANSVAVHDIRTYNSTSKRWEVIGYLQHPRYICFAIGLSEKLVVIGGKKDTQAKENTIEIFQKHIQ